MEIDTEETCTWDECGNIGEYRSCCQRWIADTHQEDHDCLCVEFYMQLLEETRS